MVDTTDSKSVASNGVGVRVPPAAPKHQNYLMSTEILELLPQYSFLGTKFNFLRHFVEDFQDQQGSNINLRVLTEAFICLKVQKVDFNFSSPEDIIEMYQIYKNNN